MATLAGIRLEQEHHGLTSEANFSLKALLLTPLTPLLYSVVMRSSVLSEDFLRN